MGLNALDSMLCPADKKNGRRSRVSASASVYFFRVNNTLARMQLRTNYATAGYVKLSVLAVLESPGVLGVGLGVTKPTC